AALGLFADRRAALHELRRVLRPSALVLLIVGTQAWAQVVRWPAGLAAQLAAAYAQALVAGAAPLPAPPDPGGELAGLLSAAVLAAPLVRAFWIDQGSGVGDQGSGIREDRSLTADCRLPTADYRLPAPDPRPPIPDSELPLLPWPALRVLLAGRLS